MKTLLIALTLSTAACQSSASDAKSAPAAAPAKATAKTKAEEPSGWLKRYLALHVAMVEMTPMRASQAAQILRGQKDCPPIVCGALADFPRTTEAQRKAFSRASDAAKDLWIGDKALQSQAVLMHCPMVPGNWLQVPGKLLNPYAPDTMLHCGYQVGVDGKPKR
jgi:hypothetical protein